MAKMYQPMAKRALLIIASLMPVMVLPGAWADSATETAAEGELNHAALIEAWDEDALQRGEELYHATCVACHGADGQQTINPQALPFGDGTFRNGADPYSMFRTLSDGYETMPATTWLTPQQRYDVIHYVRETFIREDNPDQYVPVDADYLAGLPVGEADASDGQTRPAGQRDFGGALGSQLGTEVSAAVTVDLGDEITTSYDVHRMRLAGAWSGGFLDLGATHHEQQRGEGVPHPAGRSLPGMDQWQWALGGSFAPDADALPPRGPAPSEWMEYEGRYMHGDQIVLSYRIGDRDILELPAAESVGERPALLHTLEIEPGDEPLSVVVGGLAGDGDAGPTRGLVTFEGEPADVREGGAAGHLALVSGDFGSTAGAERYAADVDETAKRLNMGAEAFAVAVRFRTTASGTLVANAPPFGAWEPDAKALFVRNGRLVYDIGWLGAIQSETAVNDGAWRWAVLSVEDGAAQLYVDGELEAENADFHRPYAEGHVFKVGAASPNFAGDYEGDISHVAFYDHALAADAVAELARSDELPADAAFNWTPEQPTDKQPDAVDPYGSFMAAAVVGDVDGLTWTVDETDRLVLHIPPGQQRRHIQVMRYVGDGEADVLQFASYARFAEGRPSSLPRPSALTEGGPRRWEQTVTVEGQRGEPINGYALDTVPVPFENPYNAWLRTTALDFFSDGRAAVTTYGGDVWIVSGLDGDLAEVTWQRYAAGLYEPMGVRVIDGQVYVTCRDGIIRLHDLNGNGEADYYETFFADPDVSTFFHAFNFDLQTDPAGRFYYAKAGQYTDYALPGSVMRVASDGSSGEAIATGFRTPNGMGMLPDGRPTVSDNEGSWMPASKINIVEEGAFFGYVQTHATGAWAPDGGEIDHRQVTPPDDFDRPLVWMPRSLDASSGGQVWVDDDGFGPLGGRLLHTSFSHGKMYAVYKQEDADGLIAGAISALPHAFDAGIQRARQHPVDGQVWATGLSGWQGPPGGDDGCLQRLRYTGEGGRVVDAIEVTPAGIRLRFNFSVDADAAADVDRYSLRQWNYRWTAGYGSAHYSVANPDRQEEDRVPVREAIVGEDGRSVLLAFDALQPVDQLRIDFAVPDETGRAFEQQLHLTIHRVPDAP